MTAAVIGMVGMGLGLAPGVEAQARQPDLCALVTKAEVEAIIGATVPAPVMKSGICWFGEEVALDIVPVYPASAREFDQYIRKEVEKLNAKMRKIGAKETPVEEVKDLGAPALYSEPTLFVWRNKQVLSIMADKAHATAIAAKALPRWK